MNAFHSGLVRTALGIASPLILAGCAGTPVAPDAAATHPANPAATASPLPPLQLSLLAITNLVTMKPGIEAAPEHPRAHEKHESKPKTWEKK